MVGQRRSPAASILAACNGAVAKHVLSALHMRVCLSYVMTHGRAMDLANT